MNRPLRIEPHHFVEIISDLGRGDKEPLPHNYGRAADGFVNELLSRPHVMLEMVLGIDDICQNCSHNHANECNVPANASSCSAISSSHTLRNKTLDLRWLLKLGLAEGDLLDAESFCMLLSDHLDSLDDIYRDEDSQQIAILTTNLNRGLDAYLGKA